MKYHLFGCVCFLLWVLMSCVTTFDALVTQPHQQTCGRISVASLVDNTAYQVSPSGLLQRPFLTMWSHVALHRTQAKTEKAAVITASFLTLFMGFAFTGTHRCTHSHFCCTEVQPMSGFLTWCISPVCFNYYIIYKMTHTPTSK